MAIRKTQKEFIRDVLTLNPNLTVIGRYINSSVPVTLQCNICKATFKRTLSNLKATSTCPNCTKLHKRKQNSLNAYHKMQKILGNHYEVLAVPFSLAADVTIKHKVCGNVYSATGSSIYAGYCKCRVCHPPKYRKPSNFTFNNHTYNLNINDLVNNEYRLTNYYRV